MAESEGSIRPELVNLLSVQSASLTDDGSRQFVVLSLEQGEGQISTLAVDVADGHRLLAGLVDALASINDPLGTTLLGSLKEISDSLPDDEQDEPSEDEEDDDSEEAEVGVLFFPTDSEGSDFGPDA